MFKKVRGHLYTFQVYSIFVLFIIFLSGIMIEEICLSKTIHPRRNAATTAAMDLQTTSCIRLQSLVVLGMLTFYQTLPIGLQVIFSFFFVYEFYDAVLRIIRFDRKYLPFGMNLFHFMIVIQYACLTPETRRNKLMKFLFRPITLEHLNPLNLESCVSKGMSNGKLFPVNSVTEKIFSLKLNSVS